MRVWWPALVFLAGCTATSTPAIYFDKKGLPEPSAEAFSVCRGYGCDSVDRVALAPKRWKELAALFPAADAASERKAIAKAIGMFEERVGAITGTHEDIAGTYIKTGHYQQDCVDESTNTTTYLVLMEQKGWLRFHTTGAPNSRLIFTSGRLGPHSTAVITETRSGQRFAVDSWYHDNGHPAEVVTLEEWKSGWAPKTEHKKSSQKQKAALNN